MAFCFYNFGTFMIRFILFLACILTLNISYGQQPDSTQLDLVDIVIGKKCLQSTNKIRSERKIYFSLLPAAVSIPGGGRAVITAINVAFYLGNPAVTNLSNIYIIPYTNFVDRYGIYLRPNIWAVKNKFNITGDYRIAHFPQYSWGLGGDTPQWDESLIDSDYFRLYQTILTRLHKHWYFGPGYFLDHHYNIEEKDFEGSGHLDRYENGSLTSTTSSGITANLVYDARKNAINPQGGAYIIATWRWNDEALGSTFKNQSFFIDARKYFTLSNHRSHILAFRSYYWTVVNGETPYLDLPATNWAPSQGIASRGFQTSRYRSNAMLYGEAEQRYTLTANGIWGFVVFANIASAAEFETQHFNHWQLGAGVGLRAKLNKYSNANLTVDFGFSQNYWGVWLNIGEVF
jgi:hypothetical protein